MRKITVFLSHSSKDLEKVRQIRDMLETLDFDPLLFNLKCLDDDNEFLDRFIKEEIEARDIFIYCKSVNSEKSVWVQKELEYIKSYPTKRLFTIDISLPFKETMVSLLQSITDIIKNNRVFISCCNAEADTEIADFVEDFLTRNNYDVIRSNHFNYSDDTEHTTALIEAGAFISIISPNSLKSLRCKSELGHALHCYNRDPENFSNKIIPIYYDVNPSLIIESGMIQSAIRDFSGLDVSQKTSLSDFDMFKLLFLLHRNNTGK